MHAPTVADVMHRHVPVVREDAPYKQVAVALATHHVRAMPVVGVDATVTGVVPESDLAERPAESSSEGPVDLLAGYLRSDDAIGDELVNRVVIDDFCLDPGSILVAAVRRVPGVVDVEDRLSWRYDLARPIPGEE